MEDQLAKSLLQLFFQAPLVNAILVFEDNDYLGVVFKKDIERGIMTGNFQLFENISFIRTDDLQTVLFSHQVTKSVRIPVIDKVGNLIRIISYDEYMSQLFFEKFIFKFDLESVLDNLDHPLIITNHFKKTLYLNKKALEMIEKDFLGRKIPELMKSFNVEMSGDKIILTKDDKTYHLVINNSSMKNFSFILYQFFSA